MDARETTTFAINEQEKEVRSTLRVRSLYFDPRLLQRENFVRYLVSIILR